MSEPGGRGPSEAPEGLRQASRAGRARRVQGERVVPGADSVLPEVADRHPRDVERALRHQRGGDHGGWHHHGGTSFRRSANGHHRDFGRKSDRISGGRAGRLRQVHRQHSVRHQR